MSLSLVPSLVLSENPIRPGLASWGRIIASFWAMFAVLHALGMFVADLFKSRSRLAAENLFLRHQLVIALRCVEQSKGLVPLSLFPSWQGCITTSGYDFRKGHPAQFTRDVFVGSLPVTVSQSRHRRTHSRHRNWRTWTGVSRSKSS